jgi:hypothetical protein
VKGNLKELIKKYMDNLLDEEPCFFLYFTITKENYDKIDPWAIPLPKM